MTQFGSVRRERRGRGLIVANHDVGTPGEALSSPSPSAGKLALGVRAMIGAPSVSLHEAAKTGDLEAGRAVLEAGRQRGELEVMLGGRDVRRRTPLHIAAAQGREDFVRLLLENGAGINVLDATGETPLHAASGAGHVGVVRALLQAARTIVDTLNIDTENSGSDPLAMFLPDRRGQTALYRAARRGYAEVVAVLMQEGGKNFEVVGQKDDEGGISPFRAALGAGHVEVVKVMLQSVSDDVREKLVVAFDRWNTNKANELDEGRMLVAGIRKSAEHRAQVREKSRAVVYEMKGIINRCLTVGRAGPEVLFEEGATESDGKVDLQLLKTPKNEGARAGGERGEGADGGAAGGQEGSKVGSGPVKVLNFHFDCMGIEEEDGAWGSENPEHHVESYDIDENSKVTFNFELPPWFWAACSEGQEDEGKVH